uniref:Uncharacterized protein n=1 Tax=Timema cristinae TaxID=61476 RepID=A0A7R9CAX3_TIMCR|nr:unnamed protein product [Timema cristinae]
MRGLTGHHPGLVALWTDRSEDMQDVRWKLFTAAVSPRLSSEQFRQLPSHLVVPAVSLFYLQNECLPPVAAMWEVDAIIAQAVLLSMYDAPTLSNIRTPTIDTRAVRLATLFQRATRIVFMLVATCGYPVPKLQIMPWQYFDGKLFHLTYLKAKSGAGHGELCNHQVVLLEQFQQVRRAVFG